MPRSVKKGPYIDEKLLLKIEIMNSRNEKKVVKTWARSCTISPDFVGHTVAVHNGNKFIPVYITENMVGHKLGEFAPTRLFRGHGIPYLHRIPVIGNMFKSKSITDARKELLIFVTPRIVRLPEMASN